MKYFLLLTASIVCTTVHAQLNKGQWVAGGNAGFSYADKQATYSNFTYITASNKTSSLQFSPLVGYFVHDNFCIGLKPRAEWIRMKTKGVEVINGYTGEYNSDSKSATLGIGPFIRYYCLPKANKINLITEVGYAYSHAKVVSNAQGLGFNSIGLPDDNILTPIIGSNYNLHEFSFSAGPAIFLNSRTALEFLAGYNYSSAPEFGDSQNAISISAGFQIHLGK